MKKPFASNEEARKRADHGPRTAHGHELNWKGNAIILYDNEDEADRLAAEFGTYAKHSRARFEGSCWKVFSLVALPSS